MTIAQDAPINVGEIMTGQTYGPVCHSNGIRGYGNAHADVMFIGIAPGRDEVKKGRPFTGPSGELLNALIKSVGLERDTVYCTNLICYWKDDPSPQEQAPCRERLIKEIRAVGPRVIYLLGAIASYSFVGRPLGGKNGARGAVIWNEELQAYLIPTYHPAGILHSLNDRHGRDNKGSETVYDLYRDLKKWKYVASWGPGISTDITPGGGSPLAQIEYEVLSSDGTNEAIINRVNMLLDSISFRDAVALDVETYNPNPNVIDVWGDTLLCFTIATSSKAWVFPLELVERIKDPEVLPYINWRESELQWTFHNAQFDTQILKKNLDVWFTVAEDTMLMSYSLDERGGSLETSDADSKAVGIHGLKKLCREYLGAGWWEEVRQKGKAKLWEIPRHLLYEYNAKDAVYTARLVHYFKPLQIEDNVRELYETILIPAVNAVKEIQYRGFRVNRKKHMQFSIEWGELYLNLEAELQEKARDYGWEGDINLQSPQQISKLLFKLMGVPVRKTTPKGEPSTDMETLKELAGTNDFVDSFIRYRHVARYYDTYITGLGHHIKEDGRVHAYVKIHGARTGRWSYGDPPLQTIPQTYEKADVEEDFQQTREMFIPSSKDYVIVESDYGKGEIWCAYAESKDPTMLEDLMSEDYHSKVAADTQGLKLEPGEQAPKEARRVAKITTFGVMYAIEKNSLSKQIKRSVLEAQIYIERFYRRYPTYTKYVDSIKNTVLKVGELVSNTGRKRRFIILDSGVRALKQAINYPIQSALGDLTEISYIELHNEFKRRNLRAYVLLQVHDSLVFEVHKDDYDEAVKLIHEVMTKVRYKNYPRLPIEISSGINWGKTKGFHDCMTACRVCWAHKREHIDKDHAWIMCLQPYDEGMSTCLKY